MARKRYSSAIDLLAAAAAAGDDQVQRVDNHASDDDDADVEERSGSELNKLSGSDPDSMVIPKPTKEGSPRSKSSRKRSLSKHLLLNEFNDSNKKARVDKSSGAVTRLWSEQDEIAILQGMIDFKLRKGEDPYSDMNAFLEFVQDSISVHVSRKQWTDKIRRLKNKYFVNVERGDIVNGVVVKEHEVKLFELSEMIWGGDGTVRVTKDKEDGNVVENGVDWEGGDKDGGNVVENGLDSSGDVAENGIDGGDVEGGNVVENGVIGEDFKGMYPYLNRAWESDVSCSMLMKSFVMDGIRSVGNVGLREMDKKWKDFYVEQLKLYVKRLDLEKADAQSVLDQMTTSDS